MFIGNETMATMDRKRIWYFSYTKKQQGDSIENQQRVFMEKKNNFLVENNRAQLFKANDVVS